MAKLTEADKYYLTNNRTVDPKELAKAVEKPLKLVNEFLSSLPVEDFKANHKTKVHEQMSAGPVNTTIMTTRASEEMSKQLGTKNDNSSYIHRIRN